MGSEPAGRPYRRICEERIPVKNRNFPGRRDELLLTGDNDNSKRIYEYIANAQIPDKLKRRLKEKKF